MLDSAGLYIVLVLGAIAFVSLWLSLEQTRGHRNQGLTIVWYLLIVFVALFVFLILSSASSSQQLWIYTGRADGGVLGEKVIGKQGHKLWKARTGN